MTETGHILVIDDDAMTRLLVRQVLEQRGFRVAEADCGSSGLASLAHETFDLVLLDLLMPDLDGFECLRRIRQMPAHDTAVVIMTAVEDIDCVQQAYTLGATDFIDKPIQWLLLPYRIDYLLHAQRTKRQLQESEARLRLSLAAARQGLWELNVERNLIVIDGEMADHDERLVGQMPLGQWLASIHPGDAPQVEQSYRDYLQNPTAEFRTEFRQRGSDDDGQWLLMIGRIVETEANGRPLRMLGTQTDITARKAAEARIEYLACHDPLTGLPNRTLLQDRFDQAVAHAVRRNMQVALMFLDLDRFKYINDTLGHDIGDHLLKAIAKRLKQCTRELDTICRQGGDEFIVILNELPDRETAERIAMKILHHLHPPFQLEGISLSSSFSIGISVFPTDGRDFGELLNKADTAMYAAKREGRNTYRFFSEAMQQATLERMHIENGLRGALEQQQFQLYFQPLHALADDRIVGVEALLRWRGNDGHMMLPNRFIPVAEDNGLILPIGNWVLHQACQQNRQWHDQGYPLVISVNVSAVQIKRGNLTDTVTRALADAGLHPTFLELELTESVLMEDTQAVIGVIRSLKAIGVRFAIDDFGTGYSSLSYLRQFSVDKLKIDRSFVQELDSGNVEDLAIVQAVVQMGNSLGLETLAEGVETGQQAEQLRQLGCHSGQGLFWNKPMHLNEFQGLLR
ncbi:MAG: EAL domain-containing protein [Methylomonas sp.]|nr:EAL domain-containing protein [Methylomonas sp.]PPD22893.1 MAG: two-component system response regulator [Methylomonas sp.]PPD27385.1 MAG: two-component system response regulator [Methylomonas sp.]PPD39361.1 MAG: two-component system response regulator [Methylomonas sp.]PPD41984.1 MAG: two-component system response regulator [Methylomonas sp.]